MKNFLPRAPSFRRWLVAGLLVMLAMLLVGVFFPWDLLRGPINRYVSEQLGRRFEITQHLAVNWGFPTTVTAQGIEIANPDWARNPYLLKATAAEFDIRLLPLLSGHIVLPRIKLTAPNFGLQADPDGRRTWVLSRNTSDQGTGPQIGSVIVDQGNVGYLASAQGADIEAKFSLAQEAGNELPLTYEANGKWKNEPFTAQGRAGGVLQFAKNTQGTFPLEVNAAAGKTMLKAKGAIVNLAELSSIEADFDLQGENLDSLYHLLGVVLPSTPPYRLRGKLDKKDRLWVVAQLNGLLGKSDLGGSLSFDQSGEVPLLRGKVQSKILDFADLAPVIGLKHDEGSSAAVPKPKLQQPSRTARSTGPAAKTGASSSPSAPVGAAPGRVLPRTPLDVPKLKAMNADVTYSAADIRHVRALPLDKGSVHVKLQAGVLQLEPISLGLAGGSVAGAIRIDSNAVPAVVSTRLDVRALQLNRLFPTVESTKTGFGKISGQIDLKGQGHSLAQMLGASSGNVSVLMGQGEISNILLEFMGLDGGEVIKFFLRGDRTVLLRCAAAAFDVKQGLMSSRAIVLDTSDTVILGQGQVSLADETLDILLKPQPKDMSILSLRSPLRIGGTFAHLSAGPEKSALAGRAGIAVLLAAINPMLALAATIETGPGQNANCAQVLSQAANPGAKGAKN